MLFNIVWVTAGLLAIANIGFAQIVNLDGSASVAVLGATTITNTGATIIDGDVALRPGIAITGFPPGVVTGSIHVNNSAAISAQAGAVSAYNQVRSESFTENLSGTNLGGLTLTSGIYHFDTSAQLTGTLTLDVAGDPNAAFHFQIGTTLTADAFSAIAFMNGTSNNIFWQVGTSATLGSGSNLQGTIVADQSITMNTGASLNGRLFALNGAVTLDTNAISVPMLSPIPEPSTWALIGLSALGLLVARRFFEERRSLQARSTP